MIKFRQFISENKEVEQKAKLLVRLDKQKEKLDKAVARNVGINTRTAHTLIDKYEELKQQAEEMGVWEVFTKKRGLDKNHTARDFWA